MLAVLEMIEEENKKLIARGRRIGKREDAKKMLAKKIPIETIIEVTGLTKEEILN